MRNPSSGFIAQKNKQQNQPVWLFTVYNYDGASSNLYFAAWDQDITFNGQTYTRFPIKINFISNNTQGQIDALSLTVGNVSRYIGAYLEAYDFRGLKVDIQAVFIDTLSDTSAVIKDTYYIDSYTEDAQVVTFSLNSLFNVNDLELPSRKYLGNYCSWRFKGTECGYSGSTSTCNKTPAACKAMAGGSNYLRFGGFPGIPTERIVVS
jgi:lambda family phage minor tail protein L